MELDFMLDDCGYGYEAPLLYQVAYYCYHTAIVDFYQKFKPSKVGRVCELLEKHELRASVGQFVEMWEKLYKTIINKYAPNGYEDCYEAPTCDPVKCMHHTVTPSPTNSWNIPNDTSKTRYGWEDSPDNVDVNGVYEEKIEVERTRTPEELLDERATKAEADFLTPEVTWDTEHTDTDTDNGYDYVNDIYNNYIDYDYDNREVTQCDGLCMEFPNEYRCDSCSHY